MKTSVGKILVSEANLRRIGNIAALRSDKDRYLVLEFKEGKVVSRRSFKVKKSALLHVRYVKAEGSKAQMYDNSLRARAA